MTERRVPTSTYRLQLHAGFGFLDAAAVVPYLSRLGISHLYLSPVLQAVAGSMHGYDVVDHSIVSTDLGGEGGLVELAEAAHRHDLAIVVDVVPNHMAIPTPEHLNTQLWDVLRAGQGSSKAHWFDVDWDRCDGRLSLPLLGSSLDEVLEAGGITRGQHEGESVLRYGGHVLPVAAGSESDDLEALLAAQHYLLAGRREKPEVLNYRRFFDVDTLIAIRVERDDVFDETHATLFHLYDAGVLDGFRIDHPDGLADPERYLERLHHRTDGAWVVVEKILAPGERLPPSWACAGTTGYDAIQAIQGALVPAVGTELDTRWQATGGEPSYPRTELGSKRLVVADLLQPEVRRLARTAVAAAAAAHEVLAPADALAALAEMLAQVDVYRAYLRPGAAADDEAATRLVQLGDRARTSRPDLADPIAVLLRLVSDTATHDPPAQDLVIRFQQVCGPVMAKGVEDTTFYRWLRMTGLNEVGGDPLSLDAADVEPLHDWARHQARHHPLGMTCLSTHDTKRNEDVRARLLAAAENLDGWDEVSQAVRREAAACDVDAPTAYLLTQTLLGAWPLDADRLTGYLQKAIREAKRFTTWNDPNETYERRVHDLAVACLSGPVVDVLQRVLVVNKPLTRVTTLATKLVQLTAPGVPDVYQGTELAAPALVDPDNRRPVDFARRTSMLRSLGDGSTRPGHETGLDAEKLWVTARVLRLRRDRPELFGRDAGYEPLVSDTPHLLGFLRAGRAATLVTRWPGMLARAAWGDAAVDLPAGVWTDVLTGSRYETGPSGAMCSDMLGDLPVALLVKEGA